MHLVDEQDDVAVVFDFFDDALQAFLELAAVLGPSDERGDVERHEALVAQDVGYLPVGDELCQPLDDGRLADARLADEQRVVLAATRQDLLNALGLALAADDRVELATCSAPGEVGAELVEHRALLRAPRLLLAARIGKRHGRGGIVDELGDGRADLLAIDAHIGKCLHGDAVALAHDAEQQVLGGNVVLAELQRLAQRTFEHALCPRREGDVACSDRHLLVGDFLDLGDGLFVRHVEPLERLGGDALAFANQTEQQVLGSDVGLLELSCLFLREDEDPAGLVGELLKHVLMPPQY